MYSPRIEEKLIPVLYRVAKADKKPMTKIVNEILIKDLLVIKYCSNCNKQIEVEKPDKTAYCSFCKSEVYLISSSL